MRWWAVVGFFAIAVAALLLRGDGLAQRPLHNDEAVNAFKFEKLRLQGEYRYDPNEYHGPSLYYFSLPVVAAPGWIRTNPPEEASLRSVAVIFGLGLILLLGWLVDGLGWPAVFVAGLLTAVSPAMVYFSRYYIHEVPLVFFTFLTLVACWRYSCRPGMGWAMVGGVGLGLMYATKETFVFAVVAACLAGLGVFLLERRSRGRLTGTPLTSTRPVLDGGSSGALFPPARAAEEGKDDTHDADLRGTRHRGVRAAHGWVALALAVLVAVLFFSSFLSHPGGPLDAIRTYLIWFDRAGGTSPHAHPWSFYLQRLAWFQVRGGPLWTEGTVLLLALAGGWAVVRDGGWSASNRRAGRFVLIYTMSLAMVYAAIPYKTPWCLLGFYHGMILLAGIGGAALWRAVGVGWVRGVMAGLLVLASIHLSWQAWRAGHEYAADFRNPYVYGHTSADIINLLERVEALSEVHPDGKGMAIQVMAPDSQYWPLPWYWRRFERIGWWDHVPENPYAPVVVVASSLGAALDERSHQAWRMTGMFELRPRFFVEVYVEVGLWNQFLAARAAARVKEGG